MKKKKKDKVSFLVVVDYMFYWLSLFSVSGEIFKI